MSQIKSRPTSLFEREMQKPAFRQAGFAAAIKEETREAKAEQYEKERKNFYMGDTMTVKQFIKKYVSKEHREKEQREEVEETLEALLQEAYEQGFEEALEEASFMVKGTANEIKEL